MATISGVECKILNVRWSGYQGSVGEDGDWRQASGKVSGVVKKLFFYGYV